MPTNREVKVAYYWCIRSEFKAFSVYSIVVHMPELIELVCEMITCQVLSKNVSCKVRF